MISYRGYLRPHLSFIQAELAGGATPFAVARLLHDHGVRTSGRGDRRAQINGLNVMVRHMMGPKAAKNVALKRRIAAKKAQIAALKARLAELQTEKRALRKRA